MHDKNKNPDLTIVVNLNHVTKIEKKKMKVKSKRYVPKGDDRFLLLSSEGTRATCRTLDGRRRTATGVGDVLKGFRYLMNENGKVCRRGVEDLLQKFGRVVIVKQNNRQNIKELWNIFRLEFFYALLRES